MDIRLIDDYLLESHRYHHTASATLFYGLHEGLTLIEEEGLEHRWERHHQAHRLFVNQGIADMGLQMLRSRAAAYLELEHAARARREWTTPRCAATLLQEHGIEIAGGFGPLAGKIFRIGLMGPLATREHVQDFLQKFGGALRKAGYQS